MSFGGDYGYKDGTESIILATCTESMILSARAESIILSVGLQLPPLPPCCRCCCLWLCRGSSNSSAGIAVCMRRGSDIAATVVVVVCVFLLLLHANGVVVLHLFPAADIGVTALSVAAAVVLGPWRCCSVSGDKDGTNNDNRGDNK
jgi:hypothetical protein